MSNKIREKITSTFKRYADLILIVFVGLMLLSLGRNVVRISTVNKTIDDEAKRVEKLKQENADLKARVQEVQSQNYIERQLRDELGLVKKGEIVLILPDEDVLRKLAPKLEKEKEKLPDPNWKKWLNLFL